MKSMLTKNHEFPCADIYVSDLGMLYGSPLTTSLIPMKMAAKLLLLSHGASAGGGDKN